MIIHQQPLSPHPQPFILEHSFMSDLKQPEQPVPECFILQFMEMKKMCYCFLES